MTDEEELLARVNAFVQKFGCVATDLGPDSVGVQGDARVTGPVVFVTFRKELSHERISAIATEVINKVPGITRVLQNITPA